MADPSEHVKAVPKCYPKWRGKPVYDGNKEAIAWTLNSVAVLINYVGGGAFFATTLLLVATSASRCHTKNADNADVVDLDEFCGPAITFIQPSSLLTFYTMVITSIVAFTLPFIGAVVDHTKHRLLLGRIFSLIFCAFLFPLIFLGKHNYLIILGCHGCSVLFSWFVQILYYAYLPELTSDEVKLAEWSKWITIWSYGGMVVYLGAVIACVLTLSDGTDPFYASRLATSGMFAVNFIFMQFSWWFLFEKREALHEKSENVSLCSIGFKQIYKTASHIKKNYRALKWYYLHVSLANSGWQAFGIVMLSYITYNLQFNSLQVGIAFGISLTASLPGAVVGTILARRLDPLQSARINLVLMIICVTFFGVVLTAPGQEIRTYIYLAFLGFNGGWKSTVDKVISSSIIPENQSTEMMGFFLFVDQYLLWLPLLVYTLMNEQGIRSLYNILTLNVYLVIALVFLVLTGSYTGAREEVKRGTVFVGGSIQSTDEANGEEVDIEENEIQPTTQEDEVTAEA
eukprot:CAMPEP_0116085014 /NCGR_PEP_ID=MMETSP0327-20121206/4101_1 /TAXON_ID=44447 /ORGANISM="Pseudo-nitzschia delicatissima, Strain B596" /LENGTH=513 /DNA_ID=CAMNT_0003575981 /DNA_START=178 /DNA_END=1719 /DNA_ORIENTATION=+